MCVSACARRYIRIAYAKQHLLPMHLNLTITHRRQTRKKSIRFRIWIKRARKACWQHCGRGRVSEDGRKIRPSVSVIYCWKCTCLSHYSAGACVISLILRSSFGVDTTDVRDPGSEEENVEIIENARINLMTMVGIWALGLIFCPLETILEIRWHTNYFFPSETRSFRVISPW